MCNKMTLLSAVFFPESGKRRERERKRGRGTRGKVIKAEKPWFPLL